MAKQMILTVTVMMKLESNLKKMMTMLAQANLARLLFP